MFLGDPMGYICSTMLAPRDSTPYPLACSGHYPAPKAYTVLCQKLPCGSVHLFSDLSSPCCA